MSEWTISMPRACHGGTSDTPFSAVSPLLHPHPQLPHCSQLPQSRYSTLLSQLTHQAHSQCPLSQCPQWSHSSMVWVQSSYAHCVHSHSVTTPSQLAQQVQSSETLPHGPVHMSKSKAAITRSAPLKKLRMTYGWRMCLSLSMTV